MSHEVVGVKLLGLRVLAAMRAWCMLRARSMRLVMVAGQRETES